MTNFQRLPVVVFTLVACLLFTVAAAAERSDAERLERLKQVLKQMKQNRPPRASIQFNILYEPPGSEKPTMDIVPDHVVVKLKADFAGQALELPEDRLPRGLGPFDAFLEQHQIRDGHRLARAHGKPFTGKKLEALRKHGMDRLYVLMLPEPGEEKVLELVDELSRQPWVEYAHPATYGEPLAAPNDTFYPQQWAHNNTGLGGGTPDADMDTEDAWDITAGRASVIVAIADTSMLLSHPDLAPNLVPNCGLPGGSCFDFGNNDFDPNPVDGSTHGTNTSGIAAARGNDAFGVAGTCYNCSLMALKTCIDFNGCTATAFQDAIIHAANNNAKVISISFCYGWSQAWVDAVNTARDMGTLTVASLGNATSNQACVPATVPNAWAIGGTDRTDTRIFATGSHHFVSAPAEGIYSDTISGGNPAISTSFGGTSASAPFVAGIIGLLYSADSLLDVNEVEHLVSLGADDQVGPPSEDTPGFDVFYGHGRANARNSIDLISTEWVGIREPHHVCGGTLSIGYHNPAGCDGETVTVSGDIGGDAVAVPVSQVTAGGYCEGTVDLNWALVDPIDFGDTFLTIEHGENITAQKNGVSDVSVADCEREVCHWTPLTNWDYRDFIQGDCDDDGALDPGHLLRIGPAFANIETEVMTGAVMVLSTDSPYLEIPIDTLSFTNDLPPFTGFTLDVSADPIFTIRVLAGAPANSEATIDVEFFSLDGWIGDDTGCELFGFENQITVPLNRDTGAVIQQFDFDDGTRQGWTSAAPHGTSDYSECDDVSWIQTDWLNFPTTDNPHHGTHAMRLGNGFSYSTGTDSALQSPVLSIPANGGVLGFFIWADTEIAGVGFAWDGVGLESKAVGDPLWSPAPVSKLGSFSSEPNLNGCFQAAAGNSFPFGTAEDIPLIGGDGASDSPFGDAYEYEHYVDLSSFAGQDMQVRFRAGSDAAIEGSGVWLDTISLYSDWIGDTWPGIGPSTVSGSDASCPATFDISAAAVPGAAGYNIYKSTDSCTDALTRTDILATSGSPMFSDITAAADVGNYYAIEAFETGTTCPTTRVCIAGGCCSSVPDDPTGFFIELGGIDVRTSWDDPAVPVTTWFMYYNTNRDPSTWGPAQHVDIIDANPGEPGIQHFTELPTLAAGEVIYVQVTAVDCGESPLF